MQPAICLLSVVPVRSEPSHRSEMVSQLLFGEYVTVGEEKDDFVTVKCLYNGYEGWVQANQLNLVDEQEMLSPTGYLGATTSQVIVDGRGRMVSFGTPVYAMDDTVELRFGKHVVIYGGLSSGKWDVAENKFTDGALARFVDVFLDTPYLWGGRSVFGTDCSGFVQQVFKLFGVTLLRDACLQAEQGDPVHYLEDAQAGDLVFFKNEKGRVMHVGILLKGQTIVHASGKVRIDAIDEEGIINKETGDRTHYFHSIRRFF